MRLLFSIAFILIYTNLFSQDNKLLEPAGRNKSNFDITIFLGNKKIKVYVVLNKTTKWNSYRFHLDAPQAQFCNAPAGQRNRRDHDHETAGA